ncbi:transposase, IS4 family protein [Citreicella sp. SE45]|nr:transposase, IS4 family protein [Citreicella sp. SE45]
MNTKLHAICDSKGRPINFFVSAGQVSDYIGARALLSSLPDVDWLLGDRGYDADWFREALQDKGIRACIPGRKQRQTPAKYDKRRYKRRNRIEIMFGRLKDWRRVATRYDRCPKAFFSAIALAAIVMFLAMSPEPKVDGSGTEVHRCQQLDKTHQIARWLVGRPLELVPCKKYDDYAAENQRHLKRRIIHFLYSRRLIYGQPPAKRQCYRQVSNAGLHDACWAGAERDPPKINIPATKRTVV